MKRKHNHCTVCLYSEYTMTNVRFSATLSYDVVVEVVYAICAPFKNNRLITFPSVLSKNNHEIFYGDSKTIMIIITIYSK